MDSSGWAATKARFAEVFKSRTRDEWCRIFDGTDACFSPVLDLAEVDDHPHNVARRAYVDVESITQPAPAPRLSATPGAVGRPPPFPGQHTDEVLGEWCGMDQAAVADLRHCGAVG
jgi:alpha-methylacyl-CoA racemase